MPGPPIRRAQDHRRVWVATRRLACRLAGSSGCVSRDPMPGRGRGPRAPQSRSWCPRCETRGTCHSSVC
eukprot:9621861-Heterocapsa_arctica.AAC.1